MRQSGVEVSRSPGGIVFDPAHTVRVLVSQPLRPLEVDEDRPGLRVAPRPLFDLDAVVLQKMPAAHHVIDAFNLEVDVAQNGTVALEYGKLVVNRIEPHERGVIADPIADLDVEQRTPPFVR